MFHLLMRILSCRRQTKISVLAESGTDRKMDASVDNPHEFEKHVGAAFLTGSVVETRNANFTSSESGI